MIRSIWQQRTSRATVSAVETVPHIDFAALARRCQRGCGRLTTGSGSSTDSIFSMYGDVAPSRRLLHYRIAIRTSTSTTTMPMASAGQANAGRLCALSGSVERSNGCLPLGLPNRSVPFGAVLAFGDPSLVRRVQITGGALTFSGPIPPADLGAATASAAIHLSPSIPNSRMNSSSSSIGDGMRSSCGNLPVACLATTPDLVHPSRVGGGLGRDVPTPHARRLLRQRIRLSCGSGWVRRGSALPRR